MGLQESWNDTRLASHLKDDLKKQLKLNLDWVWKLALYLFKNLNGFVWLLESKCGFSSQLSISLYWLDGLGRHDVVFSSIELILTQVFKMARIWASPFASGSSMNLLNFASNNEQDTWLELRRQWGRHDRRRQVSSKLRPRANLGKVSGFLIYSRLALSNSRQGQISSGLPKFNWI